MNKIIQGNCLEELKNLEENSIDSIVTDPPYEFGFMGKSWDNTGIANNPLMWAECLRVLKPGGYLLSFGGTRTYHRMAVAIEDAGFEVRDMIEWVYGSGFPKSLNIGKAVDKLQGNEREEYLQNIAYPDSDCWGIPNNNSTGETKNPSSYNVKTENIAVQGGMRKHTKGTSKWEGWGTALKPAHEPICLARKPLAEKTVAENVLKYGTGGINIDESRVESNIEEFGAGGGFKIGSGNKDNQSPTSYSMGKGEVKSMHNLGRFPANLIHDNSEEVRECFPESSITGKRSQTSIDNCIKSRKEKIGNSQCDVGGNIKKITEYGGDSGSSARFFKSIIYQAKASKSERNKGCEEIDAQVRVRQGLAGENKDTVSNNFHPTVKPIALMEYLIKMVTPKGGIVLDPFAGSGSTLVAAKQNGFQYIGIEMTAEYIPIIEARLK